MSLGSPSVTHSNSTREQPNSPWPFELILCRCMHCLEAVQGLRQTFSVHHRELHQFDHANWHHSEILWVGMPTIRPNLWQNIYPQNMHSTNLQPAWITRGYIPNFPNESLDLSSAFLLQWPYHGVFPFFRQIPKLSLWTPNSSLLNPQICFVDSPFLQANPRHVWWLSHLNYITLSYGLLLKAS